MVTKLIKGTGSYRRFRKCYVDCPRCGGEVLEDHWPPNYSGGSGTMGEDGTFSTESGGTMKHVCTHCNGFFRRFVSRVFENGKTNEEATCSEVIDLVQRGGKLLTPHDVWREEQKAETGEYPREAYG